MGFQPSKYQQAIFDALEDESRGSLVIQAVAGSGKTTTILEGMQRLPPHLDVAFLAFNRSIANELKARAPRGVSVATFHSMGLRALRADGGFVRIEAKKPWMLMRGDLSSESDWDGLTDVGRRVYGAWVKRLVSIAKNNGLGAIEDVTPEALRRIVERHELRFKRKGARLSIGLEIAAELIEASSRVESVIDFDDMTWLPVRNRLSFPKYDVVCVDEAQDGNPLERAIVQELLADGGRLVAVGDSAQAIYGFRGAGGDAMPAYVEAFNAEELPLSVSYRCPRAVVAEAQAFCSAIEPYEGAPEGVVETVHAYDIDDFGVDDAILCRNNAPLVALAFGFIRRGRGVAFAGRNLGSTLLELAQRMSAGDDNLDRMLERLDEYEAQTIAQAVANHEDAWAAQVADRCACLRVLSESLTGTERKVGNLRTRLDAMFEGDSTRRLITLSSIHSAKGREWGTVFLLDRGLCPSPYARQPWALEQEKNLMYVAITRAKERLAYISSGAWKR